MHEERWDQVRQLMAEALEEFPDEPELCLRYAVSLIPVSHDEAVSYARRAAHLSPDDPFRLTRCASLLYDLGEIEDAGKYTRAVISQVDEEFPLIASVFHLIGILAVARDNDTRADEYLRLAFNVEPGTINHAYRFAHFLVTRDMPAEALDVIAQGIEHGTPDEEKLLALKGAILSEGSAS